MTCIFKRGNDVLVLAWGGIGHTVTLFIVRATHDVLCEIYVQVKWRARIFTHGRSIIEPVTITLKQWNCFPLGWVCRSLESIMV